MWIQSFSLPSSRRSKETASSTWSKRGEEGHGWNGMGWMRKEVWAREEKGVVGEKGEGMDKKGGGGEG